MKEDKMKTFEEILKESESIWERPDQIKKEIKDTINEHIKNPVIVSYLINKIEEYGRALIDYWEAAE